MPIGDYEKASTPSVLLEDGVYDAIIESSKIVTEVVRGERLPKTTEDGKHFLDVWFRWSGDRADPPLKRRFTIGFGQNPSNGQWSAFAKFVEAATGLPCGDPRQKMLEEDGSPGHDQEGKPIPGLKGQRVRIVVKNATKGDQTFSNISDVLKPAGQQTQGARRPVPLDSDEPRPQAKAPRPPASIEEEPFTDDDFAGYTRP